LGIAKGSGAGDLQNELAILARLSPEIPAPMIAILISQRLPFRSRLSNDAPSAPSDRG
jgi:hypothetical protein